MSWFDWIPFNEDGIKRVNEGSGVYELADDTELLYIGQSDKVRRRLGEHLNENDSCKNRTTRFRIMSSNDPEGDETTLLDEYRNSHNGHTPPCNVD